MGSDMLSGISRPPLEDEPSKGKERDKKSSGGKLSRSGKKSGVSEEQRLMKERERRNANNLRERLVHCSLK